MGYMASPKLSRWKSSDPTLMSGWKPTGQRSDSTDAEHKLLERSKMGSPETYNLAGEMRLTTKEQS